MKIFIYNQTTWNNIYIHLINNKRRTINIFELEFNGNLSSFELNENKVSYLYFSNENKFHTEIMKISPNIKKLYIRYNELTKSYMCFYEDNLSTNIVENYTLKDEKNLYYREDKSKDIFVLKPADYDCNKQYNLLIMIDGQNSYNINNVGNYTTKNDPYGSWCIDESLKNLEKDYIVVGINNAEAIRENELMAGNSFGPIYRDLVDINFVGYIDQLDCFINETLLPFIYNKYNINKNTIGIGGSSCGGFASQYLGLKNLGLYKYILCFTPASALYQDETWKKFYKQLDFINNQSKLPYLYFFQGKMGNLEKLLYNGNINLVNNLIECGYKKELITEYIEPRYNHNEVAWRYVFNYFIYYIDKKL